MADILGVLFDKDGTLFEFSKTWGAWTNGFLLDLAKGDLALARKWGAVIGFDMMAQTFSPDSVVIAATPETIAQTLIPHMPGHRFEDLLERMNISAALAPQAALGGLIPLLSGLRRAGLKLGVATNDAQAPALAHLKEAGIRDQFDFVAGYNSGYGAKPEPGMLLAFATAVGLGPGQVMMVGDSRHDLQAGRAAGMITVGVLTGVASADDLRPLADHILPDINHLPGLLQITDLDAT